MAKKSKKPKAPKDPKAYKIISGLATGVAAKAATNGLNKGWSTAMGKNPPKTLLDPEVPAREAVLWTVLATGGVAVAKLFAERAAVRYYHHSTGNLPPSVATPDAVVAKKGKKKRKK